jgi:hypothetical protein
VSDAMPYLIRERDGRHCLVRESDPDGEPVGCHDTPEAGLIRPMSFNQARGT